jgi:hypothetical protein
MKKLLNSIKKFFTTFKKLFDVNNPKNILNDVFMAIGFLAFCAGVWMVFMPAAFIVGGAGLFLFGFPGRRK